MRGMRDERDEGWWVGDYFVVVMVFPFFLTVDVLLDVLLPPPKLLELLDVEENLCTHTHTHTHTHVVSVAV